MSSIEATLFKVSLEEDQEPHVLLFFSFLFFLWGGGGSSTHSAVPHSKQVGDGHASSFAPTPSRLQPLLGELVIGSGIAPPPSG